MDEVAQAEQLQHYKCTQARAALETAEAEQAAIHEAREAGSKANLSTEGSKIVELISGTVAWQLGTNTAELLSLMDATIGDIKEKVERHMVALSWLTTFVVD